MEADRRAIGRARNPEIQILAALAGLEEENHIARVQVGERVQKEVIARGLLFRIEFCFFVGMREQTGQIGEQVSMAIRKI